MTEEQITQQVISHLRALDIRCPYCQTLDIVGRPRFAVVPKIGIQQLGPQELLPVVNAICTNCSAILQLSAGRLGLIEAPESQNKIKGHIQQDMARYRN